jgi:hypothetical protein
MKSMLLILKQISLKSLVYNFNSFLQITYRYSNSTNANATAGANNATGSNVTNPSNMTNITLTTNIVGEPKPNAQVNTTIKVNNCEQVVMFEAERIKDLNDFKTRVPAFFTMSAYMINMFEKKDVNKLTESINLSHIETLPQILPGALNCLHFQDKYSFREITICLKSEESVAQVEKAFSNFMKCRMGNTLSEADPQILNKLLDMSCKGTKASKDSTFDATKIKISIMNELRKNGFNVKEVLVAGDGDLGVAQISQPGSSLSVRKINLRVPGTPLPVDKKKKDKEELPPIY